MESLIVGVILFVVIFLIVYLPGPPDGWCNRIGSEHKWGKWQRDKDDEWTQSRRCEKCGIIMKKRLLE